jgi:hypothetical protein
MTAARPAVYRDAHSALSWQFLAGTVLAPAAGLAVFLLLSIAVSPDWFGGFGVVLGVGLILVSLLYRNWPTGVRIDEHAITIGAVRSRAAAHRTPTVNHQAWGLFTCPWPAVRSVRVVTGPAEVRVLRTSSLYYTMTNRWGARTDMRYCNVGVLTPPWMRAALVIDVDVDAVTASKVRPARFYSNYQAGYFSRVLPPALSPTWIVPVRHPEAVRRALESLGR